MIESAQSATSDDAGSLRQRKFHELHERIERVAVEDVHRYGYTAVSVDQICRDAGISQRTFFNHFGTKENAVLGEFHFPFDGDVGAWFVEQQDVDVLDLLLQAIARSETITRMDPQLLTLRREILRESPELRYLMFTRVSSTRDEIVALVERAIAARCPDRPDQSRKREAVMIAMVASACVKYCLSDWLVDEGEPKGVLADLRQARNVLAQIVGTAGPAAVTPRSS